MSRWDLRDRALQEAVADLRQHDDRLGDIPVKVDFDGGVAHLSGELPDAAPLRLLRELVGRLAGVMAVWSRVTVGGTPPTIVDIGCGRRPQYPEAIGIDRRPTSATHAVADLSRGLPLADGCVDSLFAVHVMEHLADYLPLMDECHRVLRPDGVLHLMSPWWRHVNAVADPTHLRFFDVQTIKGICETPGRRRWYPLHAACDSATVFADLAPIGPDAPEVDEVRLSRFFD